MFHNFAEQLVLNKEVQRFDVEHSDQADIGPISHTQSALNEGTIDLVRIDPLERLLGSHARSQADVQAAPNNFVAKDFGKVMASSGRTPRSYHQAVSLGPRRIEVKKPSQAQSCR